MVVVILDVVLTGAGAPGVSICPASTEPARVRLRIVAAQNWRKVFTWEPPNLGDNIVD